MLGALAQRQRDALDDDIRTVMVPIVAGYPTDTAADTLGEPIILAGSQQVTVAFEHLLADRCHFGWRQARVNVEVSERPVEPADMLVEAKRLAGEAAGHVENGIAAQKALVAKRDQDLALAHDPPVEPGDAFVAERHRSVLVLLGGLRHRDPVEVLGQPGLGDGTVLDDVRQGASDELADRNQPLDVDPGLEPHRLEHKGEILSDDVAGGAGRVGAAAESAQRGVEGARAGVQRRQHVGEAEPACIVEMAGNRQRCYVGYGQPAAVERVFRRVIADVAPLPVAGHFHDTRGLGLANVLAALNAGARAFDASLGGLGGCPYAPGATGNIVTEDLAFMLEAMCFETGIDIERLIAVRELVARALPNIVQHGAIAKAGFPKNFHRVSMARAAE